MASSSSKAVGRMWPGFALNWLRKASRPAKMGDRLLVEYIAGIGMIQVNEERRRGGLPIFNYATIM